jgi:putative NADH-flavin reductase
MKLAVFGATGQTGMEIVRQALELGIEVTAFARDSSKLPNTSSKLLIVQGDSTKSQEVEKAVAGCDAVLSALGHVSGSPPDLLTRSASNIIEAMKKHNVRRLVVLTNAAARDPADHPSLYNRFLRFLLTLSRSTLARDTAREAQIVSESGLDWTIARANLFTKGPPTRKFYAGEFSGKVKSRVSRADVAAFMIACVTENKFVRAKPVISE